MESKILTVLDFAVNVPTSYMFLQRYSKLLQEESLLLTNAQYMIEISLLELKLMNYSPSVIAGSAIYVAMKVR